MKMIGKFKSHYHLYGGDNIPNGTIRNREEKQWVQDYDDECNDNEENNDSNVAKKRGKLKMKTMGTRKELMKEIEKVEKQYGNVKRTYDKKMNDLYSLIRDIEDWYDVGLYRSIHVDVDDIRDILTDIYKGRGYESFLEENTDD